MGTPAKKILVTGAAGFIGSNLVEGLVKRGYRLIGVDNLLTGSKENLKTVLSDFEFVEGDVQDAALLSRLAKGTDVICHQAAASSHAIFLKDARESTKINVDGFLSVLQAAHHNHVKRVVYASTSSLYGNRPIPFREDTEPDPIYLFAVSKLTNEYTAKLFSSDDGLETVGMRYMSVYGPHEEAKAKVEATNLVTRFLWDIEKGISPLIYGDGTQTRDSVYVQDVVQANLLAIESPKKLLGEIVNVGTGVMMSLNEIVLFLNRFLGKTVKPRTIPMPLKNYMRFQLADVTHAKELLGFEAEYDLARGLKDFAARR